MSRENVELVKSIWSRWERGEYSSVHWEDSEIEFIIVDGPTPGHWTGAEGINEGWGAMLSAWEGFHAQAGEYHALDDERVLVIASVAGRGKTSGIQIEELGAKTATVIHLRAGKVTRLVIYFDCARALADLGVSEDDLRGSGKPLPIRQAWDAIGRLDAEALAALCHPEVRFESRITAVDQSDYSGHEGIRAFIANLREAFESIEVEPFDVVETQDRAVLTNRFHARGRGSGVEVEERFFVAMRGEEGMLSWWSSLFDSRSDVLRAVGMADQPVARGNVETAREVLAAVAGRDLAALLDLTDPDVEWQSFFAIGQGGVYRGHDSLPQYLRDLSEAFDWLRPEASDFLGLDDVVIGVGRIHYRGKGSGVEADSPTGWVFRFRGGRLLRFRAFSDPAEALEAVGRRE